MLVCLFIQTSDTGERIPGRYGRLDFLGCRIRLSWRWRRWMYAALWERQRRWFDYTCLCSAHEANSNGSQGEIEREWEVVWWRRLFARIRLWWSHWLVLLDICLFQNGSERFALKIFSLIGYDFMWGIFQKRAQISHHSRRQKTGGLIQQSQTQQSRIETSSSARVARQRFKKRHIHTRSEPARLSLQARPQVRRQPPSGQAVQARVGQLPARQQQLAVQHRTCRLKPIRQSLIQSKRRSRLNRARQSMISTMRYSIQNLILTITTTLAVTFPSHRCLNLKPIRH